MSATTPTIEVTVRYLAQVRVAAGCATETVTVSAGGGLTALARVLAARPALGVMLGDDGCRALWFVNDRQTSPKEHVPLAQGDEVLVASPMSGGAA